MASAPIRSANRGKVAIYAVDPSNADPAASADARDDGGALKALADETRGRFAGRAYISGVTKGYYGPGGPSSTLLFRSTDGGSTWGPPLERKSYSAPRWGRPGGSAQSQRLAL